MNGVLEIRVAMLKSSRGLQALLIMCFVSQCSNWCAGTLCGCHFRDKNYSVRLAPEAIPFFFFFFKSQRTNLLRAKEMNQSKLRPGIF